MSLNKIIAVVIVAVIIVVGASAALVGTGVIGGHKINFSGTSSTKPELKIINFNTSGPYEVMNFNFDNGSVPMKTPTVSLQVYSQVIAGLRVYVVSPDGNNSTLFSEPIKGLLNISYPKTSSQMLDFMEIFSKAGNYSVTANLFSNYSTVTKSIIEKVNPILHVENMTGPSISVVNHSVRLRASVQGGVPPYISKWTVNGPNFNISGTGELILFNPQSVGQYTVQLDVNDSLGASVYYTRPLNVSRSFIYSVNAQYNPVDMNVTDNVSLVAYGGLPMYTYEVFSEENGSIVSSSANFSLVFTSQGNYSYRVVAHDSINDYYNDTFSITVNPRPKISVSSEYDEYDTGMPNMIYINTSGGTLISNQTFQIQHYNFMLFVNGELSYSGVWSPEFLDYIVDGSLPGNYPQLPVGKDRLTFLIGDMFNETAETNLSVTVNADLSSYIQVSPSGNYTVNETVNFVANYTGGTGPYNFTWTITNVNESFTYYGQIVNFRILYGGYYTVELVVEDAFASSFILGINYDYYDFDVT